MKNINKYILAVLVILFTLTLIGIAEENHPIAYVKYIGFENSAAHMKVTLTNINSGNIIYLENYFQIDSYGKPKFYASRRFEINTNKTNISFDLYRPRDDMGGIYFLIEKRIINNKNIISNRWEDLRIHWN